MMLDTFYIVRHGLRQDWEDGKSTSITGLPHDPKLSTSGLRQANELARFLESLPDDQKPELIISSPFYRCIQTGLPSAGILGLPVCLDHGLSEWFTHPAPGTGTHPRPAPVGEISKILPDCRFEVEYGPTCYSSVDGESVDELHHRTQTFLEKFISRCSENHPRVKRVLLVTHAALVITLGQALVQDRAVAIKAPTAALHTYTAVPGDKWTYSGFRVDYLSEGEEKTWTFPWYWANRALPDGTFRLDHGQGQQQDGDSPCCNRSLRSSYVDSP